MACDYHMHSRFSGDSGTPPRENVLAALKAGLSQICFTEHLDLDYPYDDVCFDLDMDAYFNEIAALRAEYAGLIEIYTGIELGLQPHLADAYRQILSGREFDFVIGSTHLVDRMDPYYPDFWDGRGEAQSIRRYFGVTLENIRAFDDFDVYGHLDYIVRYVPGGKMRFDYDEYADVVDACLRLLVEKGKGIEINTGGYRAGLPDPNPCKAVIQRYLELGGRFITMGSDAHTPECVGYRFGDASDVLRKAGLESLTYFVRRRPRFTPL